jgi:hypothetical protein
MQYMLHARIELLCIASSDTDLFSEAHMRENLLMEALEFTYYIHCLPSGITGFTTTWSRGRLAGWLHGRDDYVVVHLF